MNEKLVEQHAKKIGVNKYLHSLGTQKASEIINEYGFGKKYGLERCHHFSC